MEKQSFNPFAALQLGLILPFLCLLMIVLKLNGIIDWSWWIVLSPMVFHAAGIFFVLFAIGLTSLAAMIYLTANATKRFTEYLKEKSNA